MPFGISGKYIGSDGKPTEFEEPIQERKTAIAAMPPRSIKLIRFYAHGEPGYIGDDNVDSLVEMLGTKVARDAQIHLLGCSTAGADAHWWNPVGGWGLLLRMQMYHGIPKIMGYDDLAEQWTTNLARDLSRRLPNTYVLGLSGISFPLSRLLFSLEGYAPSALMADRFVYRNGRPTSLPER